MKTEHGILLRILLLLICFFISIPAETAAAQNGQPSLFSESYRNNHVISKNIESNNTNNTNNISCTSETCSSKLSIETRHEWQDLMDESGKTFTIPVTFTLTLKKDEAPVTGKAQIEWFNKGTSVAKSDLPLDDNGIAEFSIPIGYDATVYLPDGVDYTLTADYLFADPLINNSSDPYTGSTNGEKQTASVIYAVNSYLELTSTYDGRDIYLLDRYPGETVYLDNITITEELKRPYPVLVEDKDGNKSIISVWFEGKNIYMDDHFSVQIPWDSDVKVPLPVGAKYHFTDNFLYCDLLVNGEAKRDVESVINSGSNFYQMDYTLQLITIRYKKYVVGPYNDKPFRLRLALGVGTRGDEWLQPPICTLNGKSCEVTEVTDYYLHKWDMTVTLKGGEEIIVTNVPYGVYYFFEEPDWAIEDDYWLLCGWPDKPDGSSGTAAWNRVVDGVMELAFTNKRFNDSFLYISKAEPDDITEIPEEELDRAFNFTITVWDKKLSDGKKVPITGDFPYEIQATDENGETVVKSTGTLTLNAKGIGTFSLKYGETIYIKKLYSTTYYTVQEENLKDYIEYSASRKWEWVSHQEGNVVHSQWEPEGDFNYTETKTQSGMIFRVDRNEVGFKNVYSPDYDHDEPNPPHSDPPFTPNISVLPETGFSASAPTVLSEQPNDLHYTHTGMTLEIPALGLITDLVTVPKENGSWAVRWLGSNAGLLEGSAEPGNGKTWIAAHNHLNTTEAGPFVNLYSLHEGDRIFIRNEKDELQVFRVYANEKIKETDFAALEQISGMNDNSLTLITCEDERASGGYTSRRIIAAAPVGADN